MQIITGAGRGIGAATAKIFAGKSIRINCVRPGLIYTDIHADGIPPL
ncbi:MULTISPECIES: hypothetical protein [Colwellia]|nr:MULTISPECIES: hypothetical protein [Colwellia]